MIMNSNVNHRSIRTLKDLKSERQRIEREIYYTKLEIKHNVSEVKELFSLDFWKMELVRKVDKLKTITGIATAGYNLVMSFIDKKRKNRSSKDERKLKEYEMECSILDEIGNSISD